MPMTGGWHYNAKRGTIRLPPWPRKVPFTQGDKRTSFDVLLYVLLLAALVVALALPGMHVHGIDKVLASNKGLVAPTALVAVIALLVILGLRDKVLFIAARSEQYIPALIFFVFFPFVDMIVAAKLLIVCVWLGAGSRSSAVTSQRAPADGVVRAVAPLQRDQTAALPQLPRGSAPVAADRAPRQTARVCSASWFRRSCCCSRTTTP
jgi:hypothetical protein